MGSTSTAILLRISRNDWKRRGHIRKPLRYVQHVSCMGNVRQSGSQASGSQSRIEFLDTMNALSATLLPRIGVYLLVEFAQLGRRGMYGHLVIDMA